MIFEIPSCHTSIMKRFTQLFHQSLRWVLSFQHLLSIRVSVSRSLAHRVRVTRGSQQILTFTSAIYILVPSVCGFYDSRTRTRVKLMAVEQFGLNQGCVIGVRVAHSSIRFRSLLPRRRQVEVIEVPVLSRPSPFHPMELARVIRSDRALSTAIRARIEPNVASLTCRSVD